MRIPVYGHIASVVLAGERVEQVPRGTVTLGFERVVVSDEGFIVPLRVSDPTRNLKVTGYIVVT